MVIFVIFHWMFLLWGRSELLHQTHMSVVIYYYVLKQTIWLQLRKHVSWGTRNGEIWTQDLWILTQPLYHLSYRASVSYWNLCPLENKKNPFLEKFLQEPMSWSEIYQGLWWDSTDGKAEWEVPGSNPGIGWIFFN